MRCLLGNLCVGVLVAASPLAAGGLARGASPGSAAEPTAFEIADRLDLVPTPRQIRLGDRQHPLTGWTIVAADGSPIRRNGPSAASGAARTMATITPSQPPTS